jgi:hypothetical protein
MTVGGSGQGLAPSNAYQGGVSRQRRAHVPAQLLSRRRRAYTHARHLQDPQPSFYAQTFILRHSNSPDLYSLNTLPWRRPLRPRWTSTRKETRTTRCSPRSSTTSPCRPGFPRRRLPQIWSARQTPSCAAWLQRPLASIPARCRPRTATVGRDAPGCSSIWVKPLARR